MYTPEFTVRIELAQTDASTLREWRVVLGGAVRGGLSASHGYMPTSGPLVIDETESMIETVRTLLETYVTAIGTAQLSFDCP